MTGLLQANSLANQAIIDSGVELTIANGGPVSYTHLDVYKRQPWKFFSRIST